MKSIKKITCIILSFILVFSSVGISAVAYAKAEADFQTVEIAGEIKDGGSLAEAFDLLVQKIKKAVLILVGNIRIFFDRSYSKVDSSAYSEDAFAIPGLDEGFVPQGICFVEALDCYAISGYIKGDNSRIYLVDADDGEVKEIILKDFTKHAGGIASDKDDVWVCAGGNEEEGGFIYHLSAETLSLALDGEEVEFDGSFQTQVRASALCCDGEMLYVAEFYEKDDYPVNPDHNYGDNKAWAIGYEITDDGFSYDGKELQPDVILSIPEKVQGMSVTAEGNILFSTSYGRFYDSTLHIYEPLSGWSKDEVAYNGETVSLFVADKSSFVSKLRMPTLMEGIDYEGGKLYVVFESGAQAYADAKEVICNVRIVDMYSLIENL